MTDVPRAAGVSSREDKPCPEAQRCPSESLPHDPGSLYGGRCPSETSGHPRVSTDDPAIQRTRATSPARRRDKPGGSLGDSGKRSLGDPSTRSLGNPSARSLGNPSERRGLSPPRVPHSNAHASRPSPRTSTKKRRMICVRHTFAHFGWTAPRPPVLHVAQRSQGGRSGSVRQSRARKEVVLGIQEPLPYGRGSTGSRLRGVLTRGGGATSPTRQEPTNPARPAPG